MGWLKWEGCFIFKRRLESEGVGNNIILQIKGRGGRC